MDSEDEGNSSPRYLTPGRSPMRRRSASLGVVSYLTRKSELKKQREKLREDTATPVFAEEHYHETEIERRRREEVLADLGRSQMVAQEAARKARELKREHEMTIDELRKKEQEIESLKIEYVQNTKQKREAMRMQEARTMYLEEEMRQREQQAAQMRREVSLIRRSYLEAQENSIWERKKAVKALEVVKRKEEEIQSELEQLPMKMEMEMKKHFGEMENLNREEMMNRLVQRMSQSHTLKGLLGNILNQIRETVTGMDDSREEDIEVAEVQTENASQPSEPQIPPAAPSSNSTPVSSVLGPGDADHIYMEIEEEETGIRGPLSPCFVKLQDILHAAVSSVVSMLVVSWIDRQYLIRCAWGAPPETLRINLTLCGQDQPVSTCVRLVDACDGTATYEADVEVPEHLLPSQFLPDTFSTVSSPARYAMQSPPTATPHVPQWKRGEVEPKQLDTPTPSMCRQCCSRSTDPRTVVHERRKEHYEAEARARIRSKKQQKEDLMRTALDRTQERMLDEMNARKAQTLSPHFELRRKVGDIVAKMKLEDSITESSCSDGMGMSLSRMLTTPSTQPTSPPTHPAPAPSTRTPGSARPSSLRPPKMDNSPVTPPLARQASVDSTASSSVLAAKLQHYAKAVARGTDVPAPSRSPTTPSRSRKSSRVSSKATKSQPHVVRVNVYDFHGDDKAKIRQGSMVSLQPASSMSEGGRPPPPTEEHHHSGVPPSVTDMLRGALGPSGLASLHAQGKTLDELQSLIGAVYLSRGASLSEALPSPQKAPAPPPPRPALHKPTPLTEDLTLGSDMQWEEKRKASVDQLSLSEASPPQESCIFLDMPEGLKSRSSHPLSPPMSQRQNFSPLSSPMQHTRKEHPSKSILSMRTPEPPSGTASQAPSPVTQSLRPHSAGHPLDTADERETPETETVSPPQRDKATDLPPLHNTPRGSVKVPGIDLSVLHGRRSSEARDEQSHGTAPQRGMVASQPATPNSQALSSSSPTRSAANPASMSARVSLMDSRIEPPTYSGPPTFPGWDRGYSSHFIAYAESNWHAEDEHVDPSLFQSGGTGNAFSSSGRQSPSRTPHNAEGTSATPRGSTAGYPHWVSQVRSPNHQAAQVTGSSNQLDAVREGMRGSSPFHRPSMREGLSREAGDQRKRVGIDSHAIIATPSTLPESAPSQTEETNLQSPDTIPAAGDSGGPMLAAAAAGARQQQQRSESAEHLNMPTLTIDAAASEGKKGKKKEDDSFSDSDDSDPESDRRALVELDEEIERESKKEESRSNRRPPLPRPGSNNMLDTPQRSLVSPPTKPTKSVSLSVSEVPDTTMRDSEQGSTVSEMSARRSPGIILETPRFGNDSFGGGVNKSISDMRMIMSTAERMLTPEELQDTEARVLQALLDDNPTMQTEFMLLPPEEQTKVRTQLRAHLHRRQSGFIPPTSDPATTAMELICQEYENKCQQSLSDGTNLLGKPLL